MTAQSSAMRAAACAFASAAALWPTFAHATAFAPARGLDLHLGRVIVVLVLCVALAVGAAILLQRLSKSRPSSRALLGRWLPAAPGQGVNVLETRRISIHADVCRLSYGGREYLVLVSPGGATLLKEAAVADAEAAP